METDIIRVSNYLAGNYGGSTGVTRRYFVDVVNKYYTPTKSMDFFNFVSKTSGRDDVFFFTCLRDLEETSEVCFTKCIEEFGVPLEYRNIIYLINMTKKVFIPTKKEILSIGGRCTSTEYVKYILDKEIVFDREDNEWIVYTNRFSGNPYEVQRDKIYPESIEDIRALIRLLTE